MEKIYYIFYSVVTDKFGNEVEYFDEKKSMNKFLKRNHEYKFHHNEITAFLDKDNLDQTSQPPIVVKDRKDGIRILKSLYTDREATRIYF